MSRPPSTAALLLMLLLISLKPHKNDGFAPSRCSIAPDRTRYSLSYHLPLRSEVQTSDSVDASAAYSADDDDAVNGSPKLSGALADSTLHEFELKEHKPLGCSVEESLANEPDGSRFVFVAEVNEGGNAQKGGLRAGDVIVQLSGTFDEVVDVAGLGIEKIRSLVSGRPDESPLKIRVARGSDVMEHHEMALVELCILGDDADTADCISSIYAADDIDVYMTGDSEMAICDEDDGSECMLDSMWGSNMWGEGLVESEEEKESDAKEEEATTEKKKKVAPWSSRSSGSGTYVRDPQTGKMVNIDE